jgi:hypothetical protein
VYYVGVHDLQVIVKMNRKKAVKAENNFDRACSYNGDAETGVVLHSALLRNTAYLPGAKGARQSPAARFLARWNSLNSQEARNSLVESYFE